MFQFPPQFLMMLQQMLANRGGAGGFLPHPFDAPTRPTGPFGLGGGSYKNQPPSALPIPLGAPGMGGMPGFGDGKFPSLGTNSGGIGTRGPAPNPFSSLAKFAGPFGNGGGAITPQFGGITARRPF